MEGPVYATQMKASGLDSRFPEVDERAHLNSIIFEDLVKGRFTSDARAAFVAAIERLRAQGCDAVVLGCTEIPLLISPESSPLPTLDSTRLLARAAIRRAFGDGARGDAARPT